MLILLESERGGLAIDPSDVSAVWVESICGDTWLQIVMKTGASHTRFHCPDIGVDAFDLHRQIVEAAK
ncbi:hypothetical protein [Pseudomonas syringae]|uniref:hypothetical protein n=1 Tax=Pseudomonas syringae TaxID=317 RepID=UPI000CDA7B17|nr:hypothetical protein [Pseudomonas syringae]POR72828.1 hypothetical protein BKM27_02315 [Pseudomonas syringae pv. syringae]POR81891.1 hypothetical protein BKM30_02315 [Pseudomonas syringae pv. syringae]